MDCFYINLDSAAERKINFEKTFNALKKPGWNLSRFPAVDTEFVKNNNVPGKSRPGEKGCFLSHKTIIGSNLSHDRPIFILEDDAVLGARTCGLIDGMLQSKTQDWDILFTDVCIPHVLAMVDCLRFRRELAAKKIEVALMNLTKINFNGSTAYVVNSKSKQKVFDLLGAAAELNIPYDLYLRGLAHISALKAFALFPFVTSLSEFSDMSQIQREENRAQFAWNLFRKMIWFERNLAECQPGLDFLKSTLNDEDLGEFGTLLSSSDAELRAFGILFSAMSAKAA